MSGAAAGTNAPAAEPVAAFAALAGLPADDGTTPGCDVDAGAAAGVGPTSTSSLDAGDISIDVDALVAEALAGADE